MAPKERDEDNPRRILEVDVKEVSLVDRAANLRKFLVIKRLEGITMPAFEPDGKTGEIFKEFNAEIEEVAKGLPEDTQAGLWPDDMLEIVKALPTDLASAIKEVSTWMKRMAGMKGAPGSAITRVLTFLGKVIGGKYPSPKPVGKVEDIPTEEEAKKALGEELAKAVGEIEAFLTKAVDGKFPYPKSDDGTEVEKAVPAELATAIKQVVAFLNKVSGGQYPYPKPTAKGAGDPAPEPKPTQKGVDGDPEVPAVQVMADGTVIVSGQPVSKGKKFTPTRTTALKDVTLQLLKLIGEVGDEETMKALSEALKGVVGAAAPAPAPAPPAPAPATPVGKSQDDDEEKKVLRETIDELKKRIEGIERTRPAGSPTDDQVVVNKNTDDSFWNGVL